MPAVNAARTKGVLYAEGDDPTGESRRPGWHVAYILTTGPVDVPARPFLGFSEATADAILGEVAERVVWNWLGAE